MVLTTRPAINAVFTPRGAVINRTVYVERPELEKELSRALAGTLHAVVFGESGNGKSWLYKKVIDDLQWYSIMANCANAARFGSITQAIVNAAKEAGEANLDGYTETKGANIAGAKLEHQNKYTVESGEPLLTAFAKISQRAHGQPAILILDNLEQIFASPRLMEELGNIITLLDDDRYARYKIKILIVGVPAGVIDYFSKITNLHTVANRLHEISEVGSLSEEQVKALVTKGLRDQLKIQIDDFDFENWQDHIYAVTLGVAQRVHEYCEQLAHIVEEADWKGALNQIDRADISWLRIGLKESYGVVEALMNERETKAGRRNQVLYALGRMNARTFTPARVEDILRNHFPKSTDGITLAVAQILAELAERENSIVRRTAKGDAFQFTDPRFAMAIRVMLKKSDDERVTKVEV